MVQRLDELNTNLLDLSRLEANGRAVREALVDLADLLRTHSERYASQAEQAELSLVMELPDAPLLIHADAGRIARAMDNLVDNACKFTPPAGRWLYRSLDSPGRRFSPSPIRASASLPMNCHSSSTVFTAAGTPGSIRAAGWAWPSSRSSWSRMEEASRSTARARGKAASFRSAFPWLRNEPVADLDHRG